jgi:hypothetical protein
VFAAHGTPSISRPPGLVEPRFERTIEPENGVPDLAGPGLHQLLSLPGGAFGPKWMPTEVSGLMAMPFF